MLNGFNISRQYIDNYLLILFLASLFETATDTVSAKSKSKPKNYSRQQVLFKFQLKY